MCLPGEVGLCTAIVVIVARRSLATGSSSGLDEGTPKGKASAGRRDPDLSIMTSFITPCQIRILFQASMLILYISAVSLSLQ